MIETIIGILVLFAILYAFLRPKTLYQLSDEGEAFCKKIVAAGKQRVNGQGWMPAGNYIITEYYTTCIKGNELHVSGFDENGDYLYKKWYIEETISMKEALKRKILKPEHVNIVKGKETFIQIPKTQYEEFQRCYSLVHGAEIEFEKEINHEHVVN